VARNCDIFVGDGHGRDTNARIVKFTKDGKFINAWGKKGSGAGEIDIPHALAMDSRGRIFLGDRQNNRIQIFDQDGNYLDQWFQFSRPSGVFIDWRNGSSSAGRAASSSTRTTSSMSPIPNRTTRRIPDSSAAGHRQRRGRSGGGRRRQRLRRRGRCP
jgi:hypothetical protein